MNTLPLQKRLAQGAIAVVALTAMACGGEASDAVQNSPEPVPGMEGSEVPTVGTGVTETPGS